MSRSVSCMRNAAGIAYIPTDEFTGVENDMDADCFWEEAVADLLVRLQELWPSFKEANRWDGRETRVVAENCHAAVGVSEYCGLTSVSIAVRENAEHPELAERWVASIASKFEKMLGTLVKIGTFSNGESVYRRVVRIL